MAGICLGFGILYLFIGLRRKDNKPLNLTFALFALCYAATLFNGIRWYSTTIVTEYITITRFDSIFVTGAFIGLIWYISYYTGFRPRIFLWVLSAAFLVPSLVFIISPATFTGEVSGLINIILPWGESLSDLDSAGSVWLDIVLLARLVTLGYIIVALIRQFRRGERQPAIILGLGMLPFIAGIFYEVLGESGFVPYIPFGEVGFLGVAIAASLQMANSVIKTEGALEQHRHNLEGLVEERTTELERSNLQLTHEISQRKQGETALRQSERQARALLNAPPDTAMLISPEGIILEINEIGAQRLGVSLAEAIGTNAFELFEPSIAEIRWKKAEEVLASKQAVRWEDERDGKYYTNSLYPILDENEDVISLAVFAADITGRKKVEEALHHKIEDLNVLNQVGHVVTSAMDMPVALQRIAEIISGHFQARYSHIILQEEKEEGLMVLMGYDRESGSIKPTNLDISLGSLPLVNDVMTTGESLVISDPQSLSLPPDVCDFLQEHHIQGVILVPLRIIGAVSGIMVVSHDQPGRSFTEDEVLLAETIADDVSRTVEIARLQEQEKKAAAAEERSRLARDLHDSVTQTMYSVSIVAEALPRLLNRDVEQAKSTAAALRQMTLGALAEMRTLLFELRPAALEKASMSNLLGQLGDILTGQNHIPIDILLEGDPNLPSDVKIAFYRIAQETFSNIAKHTKATQATATLRSDVEFVILTIEDNGRGFVTEEILEDKMGLRIMRERAREIGAQLDLESNKGQGTQVRLTWARETTP